MALKLMSRADLLCFVIVALAAAPVSPNKRRVWHLLMGSG